MTTYNTLTEQLDTLENELIDLQNDLISKTTERDNLEIDPDDYEDQYCESLDESYGEFMGYCASHILKNVDPTAYRCGLLDYVDSIDVEDQDAHKELQEEIASIESDIEDKETEIEEMLEEIANFEESEDL